MGILRKLSGHTGEVTLDRRRSASFHLPLTGTFVGETTSTHPHFSPVVRFSLLRTQRLRET